VPVAVAVAMVAGRSRSQNFPIALPRHALFRGPCSDRSPAAGRRDVQKMDPHYRL